MLLLASDSFLSNTADAASAVGGVVAILGIVATIRTLYRRTLGRRRDRYGRLARLGPGAQLAFFESVIGEPPALRRSIEKRIYDVVTEGDPGFDHALADDIDGAHEILVPARFTESIFVDRDYYLQTISDADDTILAYSITTRSRRFAPIIEAPRRMSFLARRRWKREVGSAYEPLFKIRLGHSRFSALDPQDPDDFTGPHFRASPGARVYSYSEINYFGNPGHYLGYVFTASSAGAGPADWGILHEVVAQAGYYEWPYPMRPDPDSPTEPPDDDGPGWEQIPAADAFRRRTAITTFTAIHPRLWTDNYPTTFGPHIDDMRLLP